MKRSTIIMPLQLLSFRESYLTEQNCRTHGSAWVFRRLGRSELAVEAEGTHSLVADRLDLTLQGAGPHGETARKGGLRSCTLLKCTLKRRRSSLKRRISLRFSARVGRCGR